MAKKKKPKLGRKPRTGNVYQKGVTVYAAEESRPALYKWLSEQPQDRLWYHISLALEDWLRGGAGSRTDPQQGRTDDVVADDGEEARRKAAKSMLNNLGGI